MLSLLLAYLKVASEFCVKLQPFEAVDDVWYTCCTFHNFLLEVKILYNVDIETEQ
jgi:hypothetical protein